MTDQTADEQSEELSETEELIDAIEGLSGRISDLGVRIGSLIAVIEELGLRLPSR